MQVPQLPPLVQLPKLPLVFKLQTQNEGHKGARKEGALLHLGNRLALISDNQPHVKGHASLHLPRNVVFFECRL